MDLKLRNNAAEGQKTAPDILTRFLVLTQSRVRVLSIRRWRVAWVLRAFSAGLGIDLTGSKGDLNADT